MSASTKKKLRKEQEAASLTEKQLKEQKEAKKLKIYTVTFISAIAVIVAIALVVMGITAVNRTGIIDRNTVAVTIDDQEINSVVLSYYYQDMITNAYNEWYAMYGDDMATYLAMMNLDISKPLNTQPHMDGGTWDEYFVNAALERMKSDYVLSEKAKADNYTLTEEDRTSIDEAVANLQFYAMYYYGFSDLEEYLENFYNFGATLESYIEYTERSMLAASYYNAHNDSIVYTDEEIREFEGENFVNYSSFTYNSYYLSTNSFLPSGVTTASATEEQKEAARDAAKAAAETISKATTLDAFDEAIAALEINKDKDAASTLYDSQLYTSANTVLREWLADNGRKANDVGVIPYEVTSTDTEGKSTTALNGYYVVFFQNRNDNHRKLANVRHLLVSFEKESDGTLTDAKKEAAKKEAEGYLKTWNDGAKTEDSFIALVKEHSDDSSAADGGLFENITLEKNVYVEPFYNWCVDESRKAGDAEVIESTYGYHVMYYVGDGELSYRDYMITNEMRSDAMSEWVTDMMDPVTLTVVDTSRIKRDTILAAA